MFTARYGFDLYIRSYVQPTQCIYVLCVDLRRNSDYFPIQHWLTGFYNRDGVCLLRGTGWTFIYDPTFCPHSVFMCFVWIWEQTAIISLYSINWLVFITQTECLLRGTDWVFVYNSCESEPLKCQRPQLYSHLIWRHRQHKTTQNFSYTSPRTDCQIVGTRQQCQHELQHRRQSLSFLTIRRTMKFLYI